MKDRELVMDIYEKVTNQSDLDWVEICEKHGLASHPDTIRKAGVGIRMAADAGVISFDEPQSREYDDLYKAKVQFRDQRREYNKLLIEEARTDHLVEALIESANGLNETKPLTEFKFEIPYSPRGDEAVLVLSDWHYGMAANNIWNIYNTDIANERIAWLRNIVEEKLTHNPVSCLHVIVLGDMVNGAIHTTTRIKSSEDTVDQLMNVSERIAELIDALSQYVPEVKIYCTYGNHGRIVQSAKESIHSDNLERIIPFWLRQRFISRGDISIDEGVFELLRISASGNEICAVHGDLDSSKDAVLRMPKIYEKAFGATMKYFITAHMHNPFNWEQMGIHHIGVGSLCGTDEYANNRRLFSDPTQTLLYFNEHGLDSIHNIYLS